MQEVTIKPEGKTPLHNQKKVEKEFGKAFGNKEIGKINLDVSSVGLLDSLSLALVLRMAKQCKKNKILFEVINSKPDHNTLFNSLRLTDTLGLKNRNRKQQ